MGTLQLTAALFVAVGAAFAFTGESHAVAIVLLVIGLLAAMLLLQEEQWQA
jgi:hypothetical protein